jgi:hypothetical protein
VAGRSYADSNESTLGAGFGVWGDSGSGIGVKGSASTGRGGVFSGGAAQLQLVPSSQQSPPTSGQTGDLFLDSTAKLWLCTAGGANAVWVTMGSGGGGGSNGGPIVAHSGVIATPGVYGDNNTNDPTSIGISGASVDGNGQPGAGIGVKGASGTGAGVLGTSQGTGPLSVGVAGFNTSNHGSGVFGASYADSTQTSYGAGRGVTGTSGTGAGVVGFTDSGRGGQFFAGAAQLQLVPAAGNHPASGQDGDLFLDSAKQLWLCTAGGAAATWQQLGAGGGGGGGTGPIVAHSTVIATPGVLADNNTNDPASIGIRGASVDSGGNPGAGIGVWGDTGGGIAVRGNAGTLGYAGVFSGGKAQLQLVPSNGNRPATGAAGDLVVDSSNELWFCQGGAQWVQLAAAGGSGPLSGHSTVAGTPGVLGDNNSNDAASAGISGKSLDTSANPGNGFGVQGSSGNGAGVRGVSYLDATQTTLGNGDGVRGESGQGNGVYGKCEQGIGVRAETNGASVPALYARNGNLGSATATGLQALAEGIAVDARSDTGIAVNAMSTSGRAGVFTGGPAPLRLVPGAVNPPASGQQVGDFYVDFAGNLWYWKGGPNWIQVA